MTHNKIQSLITKDIMSMNLQINDYGFASKHFNITALHHKNIVMD